MNLYAYQGIKEVVNIKLKIILDIIKSFVKLKNIRTKNALKNCEASKNY